jgi:hypothetical protein
MIGSKYVVLNEVKQIREVNAREHSTSFRATNLKPTTCGDGCLGREKNKMTTRFNIKSEHKSEQMMQESDEQDRTDT